MERDNSQFFSYRSPIERKTQDRVIKFFQEVLGYDYLGNWEERENNSNIERKYLTAFLKKRGYDNEVIKKAITALKKVAANQQKSLYDINKEVYELLRYGIGIKTEAGKISKHIHFIDWENPGNNHFAIAEEVTVPGKHKKRPDIVIYVNGIALGVIELKRSTVSISEGIRQNLDNQRKEFIQSFFATQQIIMAGNDTQGLMYGTIETPEKYYMSWKEENPEYDHNKKQSIPRALSKSSCEVSQNILDCGVYRLLNKERFLEIIHDFIVFDAGTKKIARHNQYFAVKKAQEGLKKREGGIIWHTQGSGKSLIMAWLAKWIRENINDSRVLIITDRTELDEQIEKNFNGIQEYIYRTTSGKDLLEQLNKKDNWLIGSLVHKFGRGDATNEVYENYINELKRALPRNFKPKRDIYVFVDECHRTQSGKLHKAMKEILPNAVFIGFTGTPLLKKDKPTTMETFGRFIHTYKFDEGIEDNVILDLRYEARNIDMNISSPGKIDAWFDAKTRGLSDIAKADLKKRWGTMKKIFSSRSKLEKIVADVLLDFETKPRLRAGRGNAMLVAGSIYEACKYYEIFVSSGFNKCAIVTSYTPNIAYIKGESDGEDQISENIKKFEIYKKMIAGYFNISEDEAIQDRYIEKFEKDVKKKFIEEPGQMKLLIVVDKLLTGFDAPSATYLYIDKSMKDHGLFQAVCRVNRLDDKDQDDDLVKDYGYIVDYRDLFRSVEQAISDYTGGAFAKYDSDDVSGLLKNRLDEGKKRLDEVREQIKLLTEGVAYPRGLNEYSSYFIGEGTEEKEQSRLEFYKKVSALVRAYTNISAEMTKAGYSKEEQEQIKQEVKHFTSIRDELKLQSCDYLDIKRLNPAMRHLIDSYIQADESEKIAVFEDTTLLEIITAKGLQEAINRLPSAIAKNKEALAETIENNIRKLITDERDVNPIYYEKMSLILSELILQRKKEAIAYTEYLKKIENLVKTVTKREEIDGKYPLSIRGSNAKKAIYDNLGKDEQLANEIDKEIRRVKQDDWRNNIFKQRRINGVIAKILQNEELTKKIFDIVKNQDEY